MDIGEQLSVLFYRMVADDGYLYSLTWKKMAGDAICGRNMGMKKKSQKYK